MPPEATSRRQTSQVRRDEGSSTLLERLRKGAAGRLTLAGARLDPAEPLPSEAIESDVEGELEAECTKAEGAQAVQE